MLLNKQFYIGKILAEVSNDTRYELVHLTAKRVKQLREGEDAQISSKNKEIVTALREIAAGKVKHAPIEEYDSDEF